MYFSDNVPKWGIFQEEYRNGKSYRSPYHEVSLEAVFTSPGGRQIQFWGFYDGGDLWRLRFMPDETGEWQYEARFSDESDSFRGKFCCIDSDLPGPLCAYEKNKIWFGTKNGRPFMLRSIHLGDCFFSGQINTEKRARILDYLQNMGYNTLSIASFLINRQSPGRGLGFDTPKLWPLCAGEYQKAERILNDLEKRRIVVFPFAGFFGREGFFPGALRDQVLYIKYVMARWGVYWNLLINTAGPEPLLRHNPFMGRCEADRLSRLIKQYNVFGQMLTVHNQTGDDQFMTSDYTGFGTLQGPKTIDREVLYRGLINNHRKDAPLYAQETLWTHNIHGHPDYTGEDVRKNACTILMSAAMINYGDMLGDSSTGFSGQMDEALLHEDFHLTLKGIWDFFESLPYHTAEPCPQKIDKGVCLGQENQWYLIYLWDGGSVHFKTDGITYNVERIDPHKEFLRVSPEVRMETVLTIETNPGEDVFILLTRVQEPGI
jgi:hypothetical protein